MGRVFKRNWETPEMEEWYPDEYRGDYAGRCFPFGALALGTIGAIGIAAYCRPRRYGYYYPYPSYSYYPCPPYGYFPYPPYPYPPYYGYYPYRP